MAGCVRRRGTFACSPARLSAGPPSLVPPRTLQGRCVLPAVGTRAAARPPPAGLSGPGAPGTPAAVTGRPSRPAQRQGAPGMLPSSPPPIRAHFEHREANERDATRPLRRPAMASPVLMAGRIAVALLEVEAGFRPGRQLERHCHPTLWERLASRLCFGGGPAITCRSLRRACAGARPWPGGGGRRSGARPPRGGGGHAPGRRHRSLGAHRAAVPAGRRPGRRTCHPAWGRRRAASRRGPSAHGEAVCVAALACPPAAPSLVPPRVLQGRFVLPAVGTRAAARPPAAGPSGPGAPALASRRPAGQGSGLPDRGEVGRCQQDHCC